MKTKLITALSIFLLAFAAFFSTASAQEATASPSPTPVLINVPSININVPPITITPPSISTGSISSMTSCMLSVPDSHQKEVVVLTKEDANTGLTITLEQDQKVNIRLSDTVIAETIAPGFCALVSTGNWSFQQDNEILKFIQNTFDNYAPLKSLPKTGVAKQPVDFVFKAISLGVTTLTFTYADKDKVEPHQTAVFHINVVADDSISTPASTE